MTPKLEHVLLVEDDPDIQEITRMALEMMGGFKVSACSSGQEAVDRAPGLQPDIILLDYMMPGMDGAVTLAALRAIPALSGVPVVFVTARAREEDTKAIRQLGAVGVIVKPFDPIDLPSQVRSLWEQALGTS
ncbi:response regulator [Roseomonas sp. GCM10028921]